MLLVNDGSQLIYNAIKNPINATIVDPLAYEYIAEECQNVLNTVEFKNTTDALGHKRSLVLIDESFTEAYEDCLYKNKYDLVFLNLKSAEDLTLKNVESNLNGQTLLCLTNMVNKWIQQQLLVVD